MSVYISFSFENTVFVQLLCRALTAGNIEYLEPPRSVVPSSGQSWIKAGDSLRSQLRDGIGRCDCCIFVVTKESLVSNWCMVETSAFWGAQKKVFSYITSNEIDDSQLPPHLRGDYATRDIDEVISAAKEVIANAERFRESLPKPKQLVADLSVEVLQQILKSTVGPVIVERNIQDRLLILRGLLEVPAAKSLDGVSPTLVNIINGQLWNLIGVAPDDLTKRGRPIWPNEFQLATGEGTWIGFASDASYDETNLSWECHGCLLCRLEDDRCASAAIVGRISGNEHGASLDGIVEVCGDELPQKLNGLAKLNLSAPRPELLK